MKIVIIDCFDSFTYNLLHYFEEIAEEVHCISYSNIDSIPFADYDRFVFSPGPGHISEYPKITGVLDRFKASKPMLGVCLGHQIIGAYFESSLTNSKNVVHGVCRPTTITPFNDPIFQQLPSIIETARYHSWGIELLELSDDLIPTAIDDTLVMAFKHKNYNIRGLQFHPESILTPYGKTILKNWLDYC